MSQLIEIGISAGIGFPVGCIIFAWGYYRGKRAGYIDATLRADDIFYSHQP